MRGEGGRRKARGEGGRKSKARGEGRKKARQGERVGKKVRQGERREEEEDKGRRGEDDRVRARRRKESGRRQREKYYAWPLVLAELAHNGSPMSAKQAMMPKASQMTSESWRKLSRIFKRSSSTLMPMRHCFWSSLHL